MAKKKPATEHFEDIIGAFGLPVPEREHRFHPEREWRFDYAWWETRHGKRIAVEIHGGRFHRGDMSKDYEKLNEAQRLGWTVYQFSPNMLASEVKRYAVGEFMESVLNGKTK